MLLHWQRHWALASQNNAAISVRAGLAPASIREIIAAGYAGSPLPRKPKDLGEVARSSANWLFSTAASARQSGIREDDLVGRVFASLHLEALLTREAMIEASGLDENALAAAIEGLHRWKLADA